MSPRARLGIALASTGLILYIALGSVLGQVMGDTSYGQLAVFNEVIRLVLDAYVEPVNLDRAMGAAEFGLGEALDGESAYLDAEEFRAYQQQPRDSDADVGLVLSRRFGFLMAVSVRTGSPGEKAGVRSGDLIKTIDGRHTRLVGVPVAERLLRGAPGSVVKLKLLRPGNEVVEVSAVRERLSPAPVVGKVLEDGTGYLKVPEFPARSAEEVRGEIEALKRGGASSLVLDLRGSGYGLPAEGVKVAELFLEGGVVTKLVGRKVAEQVFSADPARSAWGLPVAVVVNSGTVGAAEIVAAALLESGRAPVVGEHTAGRAPVQRAVALPDGGLVLTVAKYVSPKGNPIHGRGVEPSVAVSAPEPHEGAPQAGDPVLEKALEVVRAAQKKAA